MNTLLHKRHLPPVRLMVATMVLAVASGLTLTSAQAAPGREMHGGHGGPAGMAGGPMMGGPHMVERMLDVVSATAEQRTQIKTIMDSARADSKALHETLKGLRDQELTLFTQPTVDARAAEALRAQQSGVHDQVSKRMLQAKLEVSRVLTPEQRKQLADRMKEMRAKMSQRQPL